MKIEQLIKALWVCDERKNMQQSLSWREAMLQKKKQNLLLLYLGV